MVHPKKHHPASRHKRLTGILSGALADFGFAYTPRRDFDGIPAAMRPYPIGIAMKSSRNEKLANQ